MLNFSLRKLIYYISGNGSQRDEQFARITFDLSREIVWSQSEENNQLILFHLFFIIGRVRDVLSNAKRMLRESAETAETEQVKEKMEDLKETMESVIQLSNDRLDILEQALPLAEHFYETHNELSHWLDEMDQETMNQLNPGSNPDQIAKQQEINRSLMQSVQDHKPVLDRLNKTGGALLRLIIEDDAYRVQDIIETYNQRYNDG
jgi:dystonin